jgi:hypothetical protein
MRSRTIWTSTMGVPGVGPPASMSSSSGTRAELSSWASTEGLPAAGTISTARNPTAPSQADRRSTRVPSARPARSSQSAWASSLTRTQPGTSPEPQRCSKRALNVAAQRGSNLVDQLLKLDLQCPLLRRRVLIVLPPGPPTPRLGLPAREANGPLMKAAPDAHSGRRSRQSVWLKPRTATTRKITAKAAVMASSAPIGSLDPNSSTPVGKRASAAAGMFWAANTTWRSGSTA